MGFLGLTFGVHGVLLSLLLGSLHGTRESLLMMVTFYSCFWTKVFLSKNTHGVTLVASSELAV